MIFLVEDEENIRELVLYALNSNGYKAKGFDNGADFFAEIKNGVPKLIILDIMLADEDGISILRKLRLNKNTAQIPVIMLTAKATEYDKVKGLDAGADDYITKPFSVLELLSRIKAILRRVSEFDNLEKEEDEVISYQNIHLDIKKHMVMVEDKAITLTYKEFELLQLLLQNKGIVFSREKIMERIWGFDFQGESRTVDMHIKTLRQKLGESGRIIQTVRGIGYKIGD